MDKEYLLNCNPVEFIQGVSLTDLPKQYYPGRIYFFKDGGIAWDYSESNPQDEADIIQGRTIMSGQTFTKTLTNGIKIENGNIVGELGTAILTIPKSGTIENCADDPDGNSDDMWQANNSHWVSLITLNKNGSGDNHMDIPNGVYELQLHLNASRINDSDALKSVNVIYSGTFSKVSGNVNRAADEILLHRAGAQGLIPPNHIYARLYGREKSGVKIPLQLQLASSHKIEIYSITIILRKITSIELA